MSSIPPAFAETTLPAFNMDTSIPESTEEHEIKFDPANVKKGMYFIYGE